MYSGVVGGQLCTRSWGMDRCILRWWVDSCVLRVGAWSDVFWGGGWSNGGGQMGFFWGVSVDRCIFGGGGGQVHFWR